MKDNQTTADHRCMKLRQKMGLSYPRTCERCGLGPCNAAVQTAQTGTADISVSGPVNGMNEPDMSGSYLRVRIATRESEQFHRISIGAAEVLAAEILGIFEHG